MNILIILLPFIGFIGASTFGRLLGVGACYLTVFNIFLSFCFSCILGFKILTSNYCYTLVLYPWIYSDILQINWGFQFDSLTFVMLFVITSISTLVHLYSLEYMEQDPHLIRFMSYLSLFTFFMLILVTANNFVQMFVGWEGVGLSSYLLINFWSTRIQANKAAIKAMLINRVGDFAILLGIFLIFFVFNSFDYDVVFSLVPKALSPVYSLAGIDLSYIDFITFFLFIGAMGKSAQFGLHTWLPDAMEGPTPVSALIHAATMVTAGVFLLVRCSFLLEASPFSLNVILVIGAITTFFSSTVGVFQNDIKKIIAYSTCSQLGYMIFACGLSGYEVAMFHLSNHAFFKALLFLGAGSVIHAVSDEQDLRRMGGLALKLPLTYAVMLIGSLALMGFPFLSGFYSKDTILELAYSKYTTLGHFSYWLGTISVFSTAFYSIRLIYLVFLSEPNGSRQIIFHSSEPGFKMLTSLILLCILSIFIGLISKDLFIGFGTLFWKNAIFIYPGSHVILDIEFMSITPKLLPLILSLLGALLSYFIYSHWLDSYYKLKQNKNFFILYRFLNRRWYFDRLYNQFISQNVLNYGFSFFYKEIDRGLIEQFGPFGIVNLILKTAFNVRKNYSLTIYHNLLSFFFFILLFLTFCLFKNFFFIFIESIFLFFFLSLFFTF
jgi:NADH-ubiquinone oxidoreductase chain 5